MCCALSGWMCYAAGSSVEEDVTYRRLHQLGE